MARYVVGDVQGCFDEFIVLLNEIGFEPGRDEVALLGDLVNRGPKSSEMLDWVMSHENCSQVVLGNHDLHMLAVWAGATRLKRRDTFGSILNGKNANLMCEWLRRQPLILEDGVNVFVHAGIWPEWTLEEVKDRATEVHTELTSLNYVKILEGLYGNEPSIWSDELRGDSRWRFIVNVFTRMRVLNRTGGLDLEFKGISESIPDDAIAWFDAARARPLGRKVIFGHWSALGLLKRSDVISLDTGCVWGRKLTAIRLDDEMIFQVQSRQPPDSE